ncbi:universal stress protein [Herbiconiux ginsengi]|uniref:Nucleotide-binding universal stress protein, UspA family n=1 Tax=Herbiconiux ginsengi TaxID=381665 RepID=A0A1H3SXK9_9MICO|nr:universal stress protein [Herbiconiux ginsengi]SDZ42766.1 Nucleotide-binding universal stress protein, UspA family [Herbiconiux ginsengi]
MNQRTVVAWDGTAESRSALDWAVARSRHLDSTAELVLVSVTDEVSLVPGKTIGPEEFDAAGAAVADEAARVRQELPEHRVTGEIVIGDTLNALRRYTDPTTLLVVGTHTRDFPHRRFAWSLGSRLAASALGPVAIVPHQITGARRGIVAGVDGSETSLRAALFAAEEAQLRGVPLHLVHAWMEPAIWQEAYVYDEEILDEIALQHEGVVRDIEVVVKRRHPGLAMTASTVRGHAVHALLEFSPLPELVVVGCRSRSAMNRFVLGSASHELILNLDVPVVVVSDRVRDVDIDVDRTARVFEQVG